MPYRKIPLVTGEIYHVFNRSIARQPIFLNQNDYQRAMKLLSYYRYFRPPLRFSHFNRLTNEAKENFLTSQKKLGKMGIKIYAFCLMPNHMHFVIQQTDSDGIVTFMRNLQNSYAKYFNTKYNRVGSLFQEMFKAVRIETEEQLLHVCRYTHLNPYTSYVVKELSALEKYQWSSYPEYLSLKDSFIIDKLFILQHFKNTQAFKEFTFDQANYQRELDKIKHLTLE